MKFNSVKEYFFRLNNTGYQLMMVPLLVFIFHYASVYAFAAPVWIADAALVNYLLIGVAVVALTILTLVHFFVRSRAAKILKQTGLGLKLELLGGVLMNRFVALALITLTMPVGLVLTHHLGFTLGFVILLAWYFLNWPTPAQVSHLLKLKGDEKEMVLSKGEAFK
ncbi:MAG: hypothetical protein BroJett042_27590 [Bacteroidota bacterium]|nr:MAG: hypothetical protein UZ12_BCD005000171 [Bacteroidetes bacterium OLB12]GIL24246.1 MAG: hypothetical protein BroJett042_27590 [Bacteroidota bacterium]HNR74746.1 hypothetical protein [Cyclobacteriaceae bacterium]HNU43404.1 hypothetical protein [Cyclobacteriaceae bacterium]